MDMQVIIQFAHIQTEGAAFFTNQCKRQFQCWFGNKGFTFRLYMGKLNCDLRVHISS